MSRTMEINEAVTNFLVEYLKVEIVNNIYQLPKDILRLYGKYIIEKFEEKQLINEEFIEEFESSLKKEAIEIVNDEEFFSILRSIREINLETFNQSLKEDHKVQIFMSIIYGFSFKKPMSIFLNFDKLVEIGYDGEFVNYMVLNNDCGHLNISELIEIPDTLFPESSEHEIVNIKLVTLFYFLQTLCTYPKENLLSLLNTRKQIMKKFGISEEFINYIQVKYLSKVSQIIQVNKRKKGL